MKIIFILLTICFSSNSLANSALDQKEIENIILKIIADRQITNNSGIAISVFDSKSILFQKGLGYRDQNKKLAVDNNTAFAIASTTKAFTGLGLKLLENNNSLKLSDLVITHLPNFKLSNDFITHSASIEDLLSHRIGLPRHDLVWLLPDFSNKELFSRLEHLAFGEDAEKKFRNKMSYNNLLFMVAGNVIEKVTGNTYENFIKEKILTPLEMNETFFGVPKEYSNLATPYYAQENIEHKDISNVAAAGSMYSTTTDMTKWIQSWMNDYWLNQDDNLKARIPLDNNDPDLNYGYALGWMTNTINPQAAIYFHDGSIFGFSSIVLFSKDLDFGLVVLENQNQSSVGGVILVELIRYAYSKKQRPKSFNIHKKFKFKKLDLNYPQYLRKSHGPCFFFKSQNKIYEDPGYGTIETYNQRGKTYLKYYSHVWDMNAFEDENFNFLAKLKLGAQSFDLPVKMEDHLLSTPFQDGVPWIEFKLIP